MGEMILDTEYWAERLREAPAGNQHHAIFRCGRGKWEAIERKHRQILAGHILRDTPVLDIGCGWGRLLTLMPEHWDGYYCGVDLSPDFIELAMEQHTDRQFIVHDIRDRLPGDIPRCELAVLISIRPMIIRHLGGAAWDRIAANIRERADKILYLEYDASDDGSLE